MKDAITIALGLGEVLLGWQTGEIGCRLNNVVVVGHKDTLRYSY